MLHPRISLFVVGSVALLAANGCAPSRATTPGDRMKTAADLVTAQKKAALAAKQPDVASATSYRFAGIDSRQKACGTGLHSFASKKQMCVGLQNPTPNNDCALDKRTAKFQTDCAPDYTWNESVSCHFALLDPAATVGVDGSYNVNYAKQAGDLCAGRTPGGLDNAGTAATGASLVDDILYDVSLTFVPTHSATPTAQSEFKMSIYRKDATGKKTPLMTDFDFTGGSRIVTGTLTGANYKYVLSCENTWGCPGSAN